MMQSASVETSARDEVRTAIDDWLRALRAGDLDAIMATYAPDVLAFDAIAALQFKGADAYREHWQMCLSFMPPEDAVYEIEEPEIAVSGDVAFCHYLCKCGGPNEAGEIQTAWLRATVCLRKRDGAWKIVHEHFSAPFDMKSDKALLNLEP